MSCLRNLVESISNKITSISDGISQSYNVSNASADIVRRKVKVGVLDRSRFANSAASQREVGFFNLPQPIQARIITYLDGKFVVNFMQTCRRAYDFINNPIHLAHFATYGITDMDQLLPAVGPLDHILKRIKSTLETIQSLLVQYGFQFDIRIQSKKRMGDNGESRMLRLTLEQRKLLGQKLRPLLTKLKCLWQAIKMQDKELWEKLRSSGKKGIYWTERSELFGVQFAQLCHTNISVVELMEYVSAMLWPYRYRLLSDGEEIKKDYIAIGDVIEQFQIDCASLAAKTGGVDGGGTLL